LHVSFGELQQELLIPKTESKLGHGTYLEQANHLFAEYMYGLVEHDIAFSQSPEHDAHRLVGYDQASLFEDQLFKPSAIRQIQHFYNNYLQTVTLSNPNTLQMQENHLDITQSEHDQEHHAQLIKNLGNTYAAIDVFTHLVAESDNPQRESIQNQLMSFKKEFAELTQRYFADHDIISVMTANSDMAHAGINPGEAKPHKLLTKTL
jgi:hypothetical protein